MKNLRDNIPAIVFWSTAVLLSLWALGRRGLWGAEDRWAEIAREMLLTRDFFHPCINGEPYFDKPLLGYWLIALVATVTGRLDEWAVRLPSAIAGLLALGATISLGRRLWSQQMGRTAGWLLLSSYGFLFWARTAEADMANMAAIILAVAWYWSRRDKPGFFSYLVFYLICFIGAQNKGLAAIVVPVIVVLPDLIRQSRWKSYLSWPHFAALALAIVVYFAPFAYSEMTRHGYRAGGLWMVFHENIVRYFHPFDHIEPFYVYFYYLPPLFLPWTPLLLMALWGAFASLTKLDWPSKWLTLATALIFVFFTASGSRRGYYILPILPFCSLMAAFSLALTKEERWRRLAVNIQTGLIVPVTAVAILSPVFWLLLNRRLDFAAPKALVFGTPLLGVVAMACFVVGRWRPALATQVTGASRELSPLIAMSVIMMGGFFCWQYNAFNEYDSMKNFSMDLKRETPGLKPDEIAFFHKIPNKMLFYLDLPGPVLLLQDEDAVRDFLNSDRQRKVLVSLDSYLDELANVVPAEMLDRATLKEQIYPWEKKEKKYRAWIIKRTTD